MEENILSVAETSSILRCHTNSSSTQGQHPGYFSMFYALLPPASTTGPTAQM